MDMFIAAMSANGCKRVMEAIEKVDPAFFVEWCLVRLTEAKTASTLFELDDIGGEEHFKPSGRMMIWLPAEGKQTESAEESLSTVCVEHGIEGAELVRWLAVMALVGRPFLKKANGGELDTRFGPLGIDGKALSQGVFGTILEETGPAFFGLDNVDVNALRTAQDTMAVGHVIELGFNHVPR